MKTNYYPAFNYGVSELSAFLFSIDTFIISLKTGKVIQFVPEDTGQFRLWLEGHGVRDIDKNDGIPEHYKIKPGKN